MNSPIKLWRNQKKTRELMGKKGEVLSWTIVRVPPAGFSSQAPYVVVLVGLSGKKVMGQLVDVVPNEMKFGLKVKTVVRRVKQEGAESIIMYGIKFVPC